MSYSGHNLLVMGFNSSTCLLEDEMKVLTDFNPKVIHIIGISGSEVWLEKINEQFVECKINIIECDEIMNTKLKPTFYRDLENHAINILYDYFVDNKMYMEAFISMRFLNFDLMKQKKYMLASINEMVEKLISVLDDEKTIILCPWKIITPSIMGNLILNLNHENCEMKFSNDLTLILDNDDINTHKVSSAKLLSDTEINYDIYNHALSILIKIWIIENNKKKTIHNFSDTKIFCLNIIIQYLYKNKRIHDIFEVWEFYKFDIDVNNTDAGYIFLYYSKYLSHVGLLEEASKFLLKAVEINKELDTNIQSIVDEYKKIKTV
jgi:tetratricopeptide (TPR) repeat protein